MTEVEQETVQDLWEQVSTLDGEIRRLKYEIEQCQHWMYEAQQERGELLRQIENIQGQEIDWG